MSGSREAAVASLAEPLEVFTKLKPGPGRAAEEVAGHQQARIYSAMVEIVAKRGYRAATVREIAGAAGVSTRAFYKLFHSKEDCFLRTYELVVQRVVRRIAASQVGEGDWQTRLRLAFNVFAQEIESESLAAHLTLVDAPMVGPVARDLTRWAEETFESMLGESLTGIPNGIATSPLIIKGLIAGIGQAARGRLLAVSKNDPYPFGDALTEWVLCYCCEATTNLVNIDRPTTPERPAAAPAAQSRTEEESTQAPMDERALILAAVAKLAVTEDYRNLTVQRVCIAAGVRQRCFSTHFSTVQDCLLAALELRTTEAMEQGIRVQSTAHSWESGIYLAIVTLCSRVAQDSLLAKLCFVDVSLQGGEDGARRCQRFVAAFGASLNCRGEDPSLRADKFTASASAAAIWGLINHYIVTGQARVLPRVAPLLAFLALAPTVGAQAAVRVIRDEQTGMASLDRLKT